VWAKPTSWQSHDVVASRPSSGLCPDDVWAPPTSKVAVLFEKTSENRVVFDVGSAHTSSGLRPDDGRKATMSWLCHDVGSAHTSSGQSPDDQKRSQKLFLTLAKPIKNCF
jgi:hypothetical protein